MRDPLTVWSELETDTSHSSGFVRLRVEPDACCDLFLAVRKPDNARALLLEVDASAIPAATEYPESDGFALTVSTLKPGFEGRVRIVLELSNPRYLDVFSVLATDVVGHVSAHLDQKGSFAEFVSRLVRWQNFFRSHSEGLSEEAQKGLYGELWFLRNVLVPNIGEGRQSRRGLVQPERTRISRRKSAPWR
jgi:Putative  PD-(D/E)XK family member, (DUF4420)